MQRLKNTSTAAALFYPFSFVIQHAMFFFLFTVHSSRLKSEKNTIKGSLLFASKVKKKKKIS